MPDTIGDAVLARLGRLSADAQLVARAGAVVGRCFSPDVLAGMVDRPLPELEPTIDELVDASILYPFDYIDHGLLRLPPPAPAGRDLRLMSRRRSSAGSMPRPPSS